MAKQNWLRIAAEIGYSTILVILAIALLQASVSSVSDAQRYSGVVALALLWVFGHFQWFRAESSPRLAKTKQMIVDRQRLEDALQKGWKFVGKLDDEHYVVEGK